MGKETGKRNNEYREDERVPYYLRRWVLLTVKLSMINDKC